LHPDPDCQAERQPPSVQDSAVQFFAVRAM
jgi:hypothetical protein